MEGVFTKQTLTIGDDFERLADLLLDELAGVACHGHQQLNTAVVREELCHSHVLLDQGLHQ